MDNRPIGIFDSGLGGLTTVKQIISAMPNEDIIYFGDTGRLPYGNRSRETIIRYTKQDIEFLMSKDIKMVVAACGTASSVALEEVKNMFDIPIIGVLEPACDAAVKATKTKRIGVIGTTLTIKTGKYEEYIKKSDKTIEVFSNPCPMFVPIVENGYAESEVANIIAKDYLNPIKEADTDTLILGCTHYPLLSKVISDIMTPRVTLIDPGKETAEFIKKYLSETSALAESNKEGKCNFYVSDSVENFAALGGLFLEKDIDFLVHRTEAF